MDTYTATTNPAGCEVEAGNNHGMLLVPCTPSTHVLIEVTDIGAAGEMTNVGIIVCPMLIQRVV